MVHRRLLGVEGQVTVLFLFYHSRVSNYDCRLLKKNQCHKELGPREIGLNGTCFP